MNRTGPAIEWSERSSEPDSAGNKPPLLKASRVRSTAWKLFIRIIATVVLGAGAVVLFLFDPAQSSIYPVCMFHSVTGLDCPGCGGLRAIHQLLRGEWSAAFRLNPLFVLMLPLLAGLAARAIWLKHRRVRADLVRPAWLWAFCVALIVFGILRNVNVTPGP